MGAAWASCQDIGGKYAGIVSGCMNTIGNLGGAIAGYVTGMVLASYTGPARDQGMVAAVCGNLGAGATAVGGSPLGVIDYGTVGMIRAAEASRPAWQGNLTIFALVYVAAMILWMFFDATKPVVPDEH
jgi:hypothetical protein